MDQKARDRAMLAFRNQRVRILVATDVVGRGIDVTGISHIVNFDIPQFCDDYVHRVGRAGRMGREGVAYTFVTPEEGNELTRIEMRINIQLKRDDMDQFELITDKPAGKSATGLPDSAAEKPPPPPASLRRGRGPRRHRRGL
jgi:ATP-dependent RNA helicase DeaD